MAELTHIALILPWVIGAGAIIWQLRDAISGSPGKEKAAYISYYILFLILPLAVIPFCLGFTTRALAVGVPSYFILVFVAERGIVRWVKLWIGTSW